jgi:hypothetical protein
MLYASKKEHGPMIGIESKEKFKTSEHMRAKSMSDVYQGIAFIKVINF